MTPIEHTISERSPLSSIIDVVTAVDADSGQNAVVTYSLVGGDASKFMVDENGFVRLIGRVNARVTPRHQLTINAKDKGQPMLASNMTFIVNIKPVNECNPYFPDSQYSVSVGEDLTAGSNVFTLPVQTTCPNLPVTLSFHSSTAFPEFVMDGNTVKLSGTTNLDYERRKEYALVVTATDDQQDTATTQVIIRVQNRNEHDPVFTPASYDVTVSELAFIGHSVLKLSANDIDGDDLSYQVISVIPGNAFRLNGNIILVNAKLTEDIYNFNVSVNDGSRTATAPVTVRVTKAGIPSFRNNTYITSVMENIPVGQSVLQVGAGVAGAVYSLQSDEAKQVFDINSATGLISLKQALDFEVKHQYIFSVMADVTSPIPMAAVASVVVNVLNFDDIAPVVGGPYVVNVTEAHVVGTTVLHITATDADSDTLTYSIISGDANNQFGTTADGRITLVSGLNYDLITSYVLTISVSDGVRSSQTTVTVNVSPVPKPPPSFSSHIYHFNATETIPVNSLLADVQVGGTTPPVTLSVVQNNSICSIDSNGRVTNNRLFDFETQKRHICTLQVTDKRGTGYATLVINVVDVNDECPQVVSVSQNAQITEPVAANTVVASVIASDADTSALTYTIVGGSDEFTIDTNGFIRAKALVNAPGTYPMNIQVSDGGACPAATASVSVVVNRVNLGTYLFSQSVYVRTVPENTAAPSDIFTLANVGSLTAAYSLVTPSSLFAVNSTTGVVSLIGTLDYETQAMHYFNVSALFLNGIRTHATVMIFVGDVNDNAPSASILHSPSIVTTSYPRGSVVNKVVVNDIDSTSFDFTITSGNPDNLFVIDSNGVITTSRCMVSTDTGDHTLTVTVSDRASPEVTINMPVSVKLANDRGFTGHCGVKDYGAPWLYMFQDGLYSLQIAEKSYNPRENIGQVMLGTTTFSGVQWRLSDTHGGKFSVGTNGEIYVVGDIDYEAERVYYFRVHARIESFIVGEIVNNSAGVIVMVQDSDDTAPILAPATLSLAMSEGTHVNNVVGCVKASDPDTTTDLIYSISGGNDGGHFRITQMGEIRLNKSLDADTQQQTHTLQIEVSDGTHTTSGTVTIRVDDSNDKMPVFSQILYTASLSESAAVGPSVLTVQATDQDLTAANNQITYAIVGSSSTFAIDSATGVVSLSVAADFETRSSYEFLVSATDAAGYQGLSVVRITVTDVNDNSPVINPTDVTVNVHEFTLVGFPVHSVVATDADSNEVLTYAIAGGNTDQAFSIDTATGVISIAKSLYQLSSNSYPLQISVTDSAGNAISGTVTISVVRKTSAEGNCIVFDIATNNNIQVAENTAVGTQVADIRVSSLAVAHNFQYSLAEVSTEFAVDQTGKLTVLAPLDYETKNRYTLFVTVTDLVRTNSNTYILYITITDVNEGGPVIVTDSLPVAETHPPNSGFGTVVVNDPDNAPLTYSIKSESVPGTFSINSNTGELSLLNSLDYEAGTSTFRVEVCASDGTFP